MNDMKLAHNALLYDNDTIQWFTLHGLEMLLSLLSQYPFIISDFAFNLCWVFISLMDAIIVSIDCCQLNIFL